MTKTITLEMDKARNLKYGMNALIELEKDLGRPLSQMGGDFKIEDFRVMLYHGLRWEDKDLTLEDVGDLADIVMSEKGIKFLGEQLGKAIQDAMGNGKATPSKK